MQPKDLKSPKLNPGETLAALISAELKLPENVKKHGAKCVLFFYAAYNNSTKKVHVRDGIRFDLGSNEENEAFSEFAKEMGGGNDGPAHEIVKLDLDMNDQATAPQKMNMIQQKMAMSLQMLAGGLAEMSNGMITPDTSHPVQCLGFVGNAHKNSDIAAQLKNEANPRQRAINMIVLKAIGLENVTDSVESDSRIGFSLENVAKQMEEMGSHAGPISTDANETAQQMATRLTKEHNELLKKIIDTKDVETFNAIKKTLSKPEIKMLEDKLGITAK